MLDLLKIDMPIIQAPMAGADSIALASSVSSTGALGSLACALLSAEETRESARLLQQHHGRPFNLNFFCHSMRTPDSVAVEQWKSFLQSHYERLGLDIETVSVSRLRLPFDESTCEVLEEVKPAVVSFHFGLPATRLVERLKKCKIKILASATSVREAKWLEDHGCDAVIAQGLEAGGHRAMFLETNLATQVGLFALLPQVVDGVSIPVIAAGSIADGRGIAAALALGAAGVQMGTAYLFCPEARISALYRQALARAGDTATVVTNLFTGRPARGVLNKYLTEAGVVSPEALAFPHAASLLGPLRAASEETGSIDYMQLWAGQATRLCKAMPADELTRSLAADVLSRL